jgi:hypothetical protein
MDVTVSGPMYAALGYDFLAVTDHNLAVDEPKLAAWQEMAGLVLIPGEESGNTDHIVELGIHEATPTLADDYAARAQALRGGGGFVFAAHPQEYAQASENIRRSVDSLHGLEIFNGLREARGCDELANLRLWDELLTAGSRIWGVAVDDFHCDYITPGHGWVWVQVPEATRTITWQLIVRQLKSGAFYATTYPRFDAITLKNDVLRVRAGKYTQQLMVLGPDGQILHSVREPQLEWTAEPDLTYFRVEARCGIKRAWSQPFYQA